MDERRVRREDHDGVVHLVLNRPDAANSVDVELARDLRAAVDRCAEDTAVRCVLLRGEGERFCSGGDLRTFAELGEELPGYLREVTAHFHAAIGRLARLDAPVVAAVQGAAAGAGMSLACAADIVLVGESARFVAAYTRAGLTPDGSLTWQLPRLVGQRQAMALLLTNRVVGAQEAVELGLATQMVPDDEVLTTAERLTTQLARGPRRSLGATARLVRGSWTAGLETQMEAEAAELAAAAGRDDAREGIAAFLEKRAPDFPHT